MDLMQTLDTEIKQSKLRKEYINQFRSSTEKTISKLKSIQKKLVRRDGRSKGAAKSAQNA